MHFKKCGLFKKQLPFSVLSMETCIKSNFKVSILFKLLTISNPAFAFKEIIFKEKKKIKKNFNKIVFQKYLTVNDLKYRYKNSKNKIKIDVKIKKGEFIGICGKTGVGKSTFINILSGLLEKESGIINLDGKTVDNFENDEWKKKLVMQLKTDI
mgnify:CR=1 FL=1